VAKAGYEAGLTCEYGRVRRGSDPMRHEARAIEKSMDFATSATSSAQGISASKR